MGTNSSKVLKRANGKALSEILSGDFRQACAALAQAAAAMTALASAIGKGSFVSATSSPALSPAPSPVTVRDAVNDFLMAKARAGRSDRYLAALRVSLGSFVFGRAHTALEAVTITDLETWLEAKNWAARTRAGYLSDVAVFYNWSIRRGLARENPAAAVELPAVDSCPPVIHTPGEVRSVLEFAREYDPNLCRLLAIRYFAGLRTSETDKIGPEAVLPGHIEVTAARAKTRRRRLVTIHPTLAAWLALGGSFGFGDRGHRWRAFARALGEARGVAMPHNVTRHSFVSYHLAEFGNAGKTALEAGHSEQMLFAHYRELVTPDAAREFWAIRPK